MPNKKNKNFTTRPLPQANETKNFDHYLNGSVTNETINNSLSEIFEDDNGKRVNVKQVTIKPKRTFFTWVGIVVFYLLIIGLIGGGIYYWFVHRNSDATALDIQISAAVNFAGYLS